MVSHLIEKVMDHWPELQSMKNNTREKKTSWFPAEIDPHLDRKPSRREKGGRVEPVLNTKQHYHPTVDDPSDQNPPILRKPAKSTNL